MLIDFISMDLIAPFETTIRGNQHTLSVIYILMNYVMCVPVVDKSANTVVNTYLREVYCRLRGRQKIVSGNRSEFQYSLFL